MNEAHPMEQKKKRYNNAAHPDARISLTISYVKKSVRLTMLNAVQQQ